jgi:hypothetical protein
MINSVSKLSSIASKSNQPNIRFNGSLPISMRVLEELPLNRYKLLLGNKEFTTKSQKKLKKGAHYWGNFGEGKGGIITLSNLIKKPSFLENENGFLDIDLEEFFQELYAQTHPTRYLKNWILNALALPTIDKTVFKSLSNMLLSLNHHIIHLPFKSYNKPILVQFQSNFQNELLFYFAYDNLGPIRGILKKSQENFLLTLEVSFEKSSFYLNKELSQEDFEYTIRINKTIEPLFDSEKMVLDIKG